mgnify:CR=1 FL=1
MEKVKQISYSALLITFSQKTSQTPHILISLQTIYF